MKIDCHLHLPTFEGLCSLEEKKYVLMKELNRNEVDYAIVIPDHIKGSSIGDLDECIELFKNQPNIFLMGTLNILKDDQSIHDKLDMLFKEKVIKAIKIFPGHDPHYPNDLRLTKIFELCVQYNAPIVIHTGGNSGNPDVKYNDPKYIVEVANKYKDLKIIIAHYFWPRVEYCYNITRAYDNIYFDTSALADEEVQAETGKDKIIYILEKTINDNPKKILFGTDYGMCDIGKHIELINSLNIDDEYKERIFYKNAVEIFNLELQEIGK